MKHPTYDEAVSNKVKYSPYFTFGDSKAEFYSYARLKDHEIETGKRYIGYVNRIITGYRNYIRVLRENVIVDSKESSHFKRHALKLLREETSGKITKIAEIEGCHSLILNMISKSAKNFLRDINE